MGASAARLATEGQAIAPLCKTLTVEDVDKVAARAFEELDPAMLDTRREERG